MNAHFTTKVESKLASLFTFWACAFEQPHICAVLSIGMMLSQSGRKVATILP